MIRRSWCPCGALVAEISREIPIVFLVHPRTRQRIESWPRTGRRASVSSSRRSYTDMLSLTASATASLRIAAACGGDDGARRALRYLARRDRAAVTVDVGTSEVVGRDPGRIAPPGAASPGSGSAARCPSIGTARRRAHRRYPDGPLFRPLMGEAPLHHPQDRRARRRPRVRGLVQSRSPKRAST